MADQPTTADEVLAYCQDEDIRFMRLWFTDLLGQLKSFSINESELEDAFEGGMGFDGSSITGFNPIEESDMIAMPDPVDLQHDPVAPGDRGQGRAHVLRRAVPGGEPYEGDPRWILQRALERAREMGFEAFNVGPELEFFYFRSAKPGRRHPRGP